jgi:hypothetical protein
MATSPIATESPEKGKRMRSPAYPFIGLSAALKRAREFYDKEQRNAASLRVAAKHWNYEAKSSGGLQTAAAMISFGLMQDEGTGDKRTIKLTQNALRILLDGRPDSPERLALIKQAALAPRIHAQLWKKWGAALPSTENLKHMLMFDWEPPFNENTVEGFIKEYRDTIAFAKLAESDTVTSEVKDNGGDEVTKPPYVPKIGDWVQWEHNGALGLPEAKRIKGFAPGGEYAYVESQHGAVMASELIPAEAPSSTPSNLPEANTQQRISPPPKTHMQEFVVPLSDGSKAVFQWPSSLSPEDIADLKDSLKIVERKITRSATTPDNKPSELSNAAKTWAKL